RAIGRAVRRARWARSGCAAPRLRNLDTAHRATPQPSGESARRCRAPRKRIRRAAYSTCLREIDARSDPLYGTCRARIDVELEDFGRDGQRGAGIRDVDDAADATLDG